MTDWAKLEITTPSFRIIQQTQIKHVSSTHTHKQTQSLQGANGINTSPSLHSTPIKSNSNSNDGNISNSTSPTAPPLTSSRGRVIKLKLRPDEEGGTSWSAASPSPEVPSIPPTPTNFPQLPPTTATATSPSTIFATPAPVTPAKRKADSTLVDSRPTGIVNDLMPPPSTTATVKIEPTTTSANTTNDEEVEDLSDMGMALRHSRALHQLKREYVLNTLKRHKLKRSVSTPRTPGLQATPKTPRVSHARGAMKLMRESSLNQLHTAAKEPPSSPTSMSPMQSPLGGAKETASSMDWSVAAAASPNSGSSSGLAPPPGMSRQISLEPFSLTPRATTEEDATMQPVREDNEQKQPPDNNPSLQHQSSVGSGNLVLHPSAKEEEKGDPCSSPTSDQQFDASLFTDVYTSVLPLPTPWSLQSAGIDPSSMFYLKAWTPSPSVTQPLAQPKYNYDPTVRPWKVPKKYILCFTPPLDAHARHLTALHSSNPNSNILVLPAAAFKEAQPSSAAAGSGGTHTDERENRHSHHHGHHTRDRSEEAERGQTSEKHPSGKSKKKAAASSSATSTSNATAPARTGSTRQQAMQQNAASSASHATTSTKAPSSSRAHAALDAELQEKQKLLAYLQVRCQYLRVLQQKGDTPNSASPGAISPTNSLVGASPSPTGSSSGIGGGVGGSMKPPPERKHQTRVKKEHSTASSNVPASSPSSASTPRTPRSQAGTPRNTATAASPVNAPASTAAVVKAESVRADTPPTGNMMIVPASGSSSGSSAGSMTFPPLGMLSGTQSNLASTAMMLGLGTSSSSSSSTAPLPSPLGDLSNMYNLSSSLLGLPFNYDASQLSQLAGMDVPTMVMMAQAQFQLSLMNPTLLGLTSLSNLMFPFGAPPTTNTALNAASAMSLLSNSSNTTDTSTTGGTNSSSSNTNSNSK